MNLILLIFFSILSFSNSEGEKSNRNELLDSILHSRGDLESTGYAKMKVKETSDVTPDEPLLSASLDNTLSNVRKRPGVLPYESAQSEVKKPPGPLPDIPLLSKVKKRPGVGPDVPSSNKTEDITKNILSSSTRGKNLTESHSPVFETETEIKNSSIVARKGVRNGVDSEAVSSIAPRKGVGLPSGRGKTFHSSSILTGDTNLPSIQPHQPIVNKSSVITHAQNLDDNQSKISNSDSNTDSVEETSDNDSEENVSNEEEDLSEDVAANDSQIDSDNESVPQSSNTNTDNNNLVTTTTTTLPPTISQDVVANVSTNFSIDLISTTLAPPAEIATTLTKPTTASFDDTGKMSSSTAIIIAILMVILVCSLIGFISYKRLKAYWYRRHYSRVDFLIDGLYEM